MDNPFYLSQAAYFGLFLAFCSPKQRWLRGGAAAAALGFVWLSFFAGPEPLWTPLLWNAAFAVVNVVHLWRESVSGSDATLNAIETFLKKTALSNFPVPELKKFVALANVGELPAGHQVIREGQELQYLFLVLQGGVDIQKKGNKIAELKEGNFVGEMSLLTKSLTRADVYTNAPSRFMVWKHSDIDNWVEADPVRLSFLQTALGTQVVEELLRQNQRLHESMEVSA